ncbi:MAG: hypothetical protein R3E39_08200 [Anaerolineae bacterium]
MAATKTWTVLVGVERETHRYILLLRPLGWAKINDMLIPQSGMSGTLLLAQHLCRFE